MSYISWSRAAYVFFVLAVLAALLKLGTIGLSDPEPLGQASAKASRTERTEVQKKPSVKPDVPDVRKAVVKKSAKDSSAIGRGIGEAASISRETRDGALIFYRPTKGKAVNFGESSKGNPPSSGSSGERSLQSRQTGPVCGDLRNVPRSSKVVFPLSDEFFDSYEDTWGAARPQGGHEGTDLMTPMNTPEYAMTDGTVVPVSGANGNGWNSLGGYTLMLRADYSVGPVKEGDLFYYAHLDREASLKIGTRVQAGQLIGYAGDTGQGSEITRGLFPPHLHLGWYDTSGARTDLASGAMNPYPLLEWIKSNGGAVSGGTDAKFCTAPQTGAPNPSTGETTWPTPSNPGESPDIDTGTANPAPSPVVKRDTPKDSPRSDKPSKNNNPGKDKPAKDKLDKNKLNVDPPDVVGRPDSGVGAKDPRPKLSRVEDLVGRVRDFIGKDRKNDERSNPSNNNAGEATKSNARPKKDPPINDDKNRCKSPNDSTDGENAEDKVVAKAKQKCNEPTETPTDEPSPATPKDGNTDGETPDDETIEDEIPNEEPVTGSEEPDDPPTLDQYDESDSEAGGQTEPSTGTSAEEAPLEEAPTEVTSETSTEIPAE